jgi:hypothetical protein
VPVPCFLLFLCFRKATQEIFSELVETKAEVPIFSNMRWSPKRRRGASRQVHHRVAQPTPGPCHQVVWPPGPPPSATLPPIYSPRWENPNPINFLENILQAAAVINTRSRGSRNSSRHPTGGGNHHRRPSSSPCLPPEWCVTVWVVYLGLRVHSSSKMVVLSSMCFMFRSCELPIMIKIIVV